MFDTMQTMLGTIFVLILPSLNPVSSFTQQEDSKLSQCLDKDIIILPSKFVDVMSASSYTTCSVFFSQIFYRLVFYKAKICDISLDFSGTIYLSCKIRLVTKCRAFICRT